MIPDMSKEAEQSVLGALLIDPDGNRNVIDNLTEGHFKIDSHKAIVRAIHGVLAKGSTVDMLTVDEYLESTGQSYGCDMGYLSDLCENTAGITSGKVWSYYMILCEKMQRRNVVRAAQEAIEAAQTLMDVDEVVEVSQSALMAIEGDTERDTVGIQEVVKDAINAIEERHTRKEGTLLGVPTGLTELDMATMGYQPGLIVVAGRPGAGKTIMGLTALLGSGKHGYDCLGINLEMANDQLAERAISDISGVPYSQIRDPKTMFDENWHQVALAGTQLMSMPIQFMDNMSVSLARIKAVIRTWHRKAKNPGLVMIDYLQLMQLSGAGNKTDQVGEITRALKMLSRELGVPIMLLSQLSRNLESRPNKRPIPSDLRDSGSIEQDADLILFLYRDEVYNPDSPHKGIAEIIIG
ncbi:MAG TPA: DnaB-like helicase C-terminal domain-containing protein, partial [Candidatus Obscuribacterales bacterium]